MQSCLRRCQHDHGGHLCISINNSLCLLESLQLPPSSRGRLEGGRGGGGRGNYCRNKAEAMHTYSITIHFHNMPQLAWVHKGSCHWSGKVQQEQNKGKSVLTSTEEANMWKHFHECKCASHDVVYMHFGKQNKPNQKKKQKKTKKKQKKQQKQKQINKQSAIVVVSLYSHLSDKFLQCLSQGSNLTSQLFSLFPHLLCLLLWLLCLLL